MTDTDSTSFVLEEEYSVLLFCEKFSGIGADWKKKFAEVYAAAIAKNIPCFIITAEPGQAIQELAGTSFKDIPVFKCDYKAIQTASRAELTIYLLKKGTVISKYSGKNMNNTTNDLKPLAVLEKKNSFPVETMPVDTSTQRTVSNNQ
jgi:hypothetical protein